MKTVSEIPPFPAAPRSSDSIVSREEDAVVPAPELSPMPVKKTALPFHLDPRGGVLIEETGTAAGSEVSVLPFSPLPLR